MSRATLIALGLLFALPAAARGRTAPKGQIKAVFSVIERALRSKKEQLFASRWHPAGYRVNLVGGSGIPGRSVYRQGARKGWYLKPNLATVAGMSKTRGRPWIVACQVYSWRKRRAVDAVHALLVRHKGRLVVLGAGERKAEVVALGRRWIAKKPLPPKKR